jgi:hypothetical protein
VADMLVSRMNKDLYIKELEIRCEELQDIIMGFESHHTIKVPTLEPGFCDRDYALLHASFAILVEFVEGEWHNNPPFRDMNDATIPGDEVSFTKENNDLKEIMALYDWWKKEYPEFQKKGMYETYDIENEKLTRLIALRKYLWT